jgi:L-serine dehydratase
MGLMGEWPDAIDPTQIGQRIHTCAKPTPCCWTPAGAVRLDADMRLLDENLPFHPNAMTLVAEGDDGELHRDTYYSVGGGFVVDEAQARAVWPTWTAPSCPTIFPARWSCCSCARPTCASPS